MTATEATTPTEATSPAMAPAEVGAERFVLASEAGLSAYWRRDMSPVEIVELAKLLRSIRKVVSYVGRNVGEVVWEGMAANDGDICLDPSVVSGCYPVSSSTVDIAVGIAIRNAYQAIEWSEHVKTSALARSTLPPVYQYKFALWVDMAERVYADLCANRSALGRYAEKARQWEIGRAREGLGMPPTFTELLHDWWEVAADRAGSRKVDYHARSVLGMQGSISLDKYYATPLAVLDGVTGLLTQECWSLPSVAARAEYRRELYEATFSTLLNYVKFWPGDRKDPFLLAGAQPEELCEEDEPEEHMLCLQEAEEIEHRLAGKRVDFTPQVRSLVGNLGEVARVEGSDLVLPGRDAVDHALAHRIRAALHSIAEQNVAFNRGLTSGNIDRRRLYRAPTTGQVFHLKLRRFELHNDVALLVDCTGSMAEPTRWTKVEVIYQTIFSQLVRFNPSARLFGYSERGSTCRLTELYRAGRFYSVQPHGKTASGEAIMATALMMRGRRRPLILHLTDGASNWGCGVPEALRSCERQGVRVLTLGLDCDPISVTALTEEYGDLIKFVDDVAKLPETLRSLLAARKSPRSAQRTPH